MKRLPALAGLFLVSLVAVTPAPAESVAQFKVEGMTCRLCVPAVKKSIEAVKGIKNAEVSLKEGKAIVEYDEKKTDPSEIIKAIEKAGYKAVLEGK